MARILQLCNTPLAGQWIECVRGRRPPSGTLFNKDGIDRDDFIPCHLSHGARYRPTIRYS